MSPSTWPGDAARLRRRCVLLGAVTGLLGACSSMRPAPPTRASASIQYSGRLSLSVEPSNRLQADFDLSGDARQGHLTLSGPLGQTLALLQWSPGETTLIQGGQRRGFSSPQDLITELTGATLPWEAFFAWLNGDAWPATGWQVDLSRHAEGRIAARRDQPAPRVDLRVQLSR